MNQGLGSKKEPRSQLEKKPRSQLGNGRTDKKGENILIYK
jgi:hypothetical protein